MKDIIDKIFDQVMDEVCDDPVRRFAELILEQERKKAAEHYLKLIRDCVATEREACAKVAESEPKVWRTDAPAPQQRIAAAIRARSKHD